MVMPQVVSFIRFIEKRQSMGRHFLTSPAFRVSSQERDMTDELRLRIAMTGVCKRLEQNGLIAATDGNVSCRVAPDRILVTPSGTTKGSLQPLDLLLLDFEGQVKAGRGKPSSEIRMHMEVYRRRNDVQAVVHAHPPALTALTIAGVPFISNLVPEVWLTVGAVPTAPYATPSTQEVPESIAPLLAKHRAILLERHGSLTVGKDLNEAYWLVEKLEQAARVQIYAQAIKGELPSPLPPAAMLKLNRLSHG
jgi:L-fuculose-phosphate aldolase